MNQFFNC